MPLTLAESVWDARQSTPKAAYREDLPEVMQHKNEFVADQHEALHTAHHSIEPKRPGSAR